MGRSGQYGPPRADRAPIAVFCYGVYGDPAHLGYPLARRRLLLGLRKLELSPPRRVIGFRLARSTVRRRRRIFKMRRCDLPRRGAAAVSRAYFYLHAIYNEAPSMRAWKLPS